MKVWHPDARKVILPNAGGFVGGGRKIVLHTTEGSSAIGALNALRSANAAPHFVIDPSGKNGQLFQCIPLHLAARALAHPSGPETNRANAIQIEMVGFAAETDEWSERKYGNVRDLCRWIARQFDVPMRSDVTFKASGAKRMGGMEFYNYAGICGHEHVPGNDHWDPGNFHVNRLMKDGKQHGHKQHGGRK